MAEKIRVSSLDSLFACAPSVLNKESVRIGSVNDAATLGKAVHDMVANYVENGKYNVASSCQHHGLSKDAEDEASGLMLYATKAWDELERYFPTPRTEAVVRSETIKVGEQSYELVGTCDVISPIGTGQGIFVDWKTGYLDDGYHQQMNGYAYNLWCVLGKPDDVAITGIVAFLRHRYYRVMKWDAKRLRDWEYDLTHNVLSKTNEYRPGKQCRYCDLYATCEARKAVVEGTLDTMLFRNSTGQHTEYQEFLDDARELLAGLTEHNKDHKIVAETISTLLFRMRMGQQAIDDTRKLIRDALERVGPIRLDERTALALRNVDIESVDPVRAMRPLRSFLSDTQICEAMRLSLPKLLTAYANQQQRGQKSDARKQLHDVLNKAGAITVKPQQRMEEVDVSDVDEPQPEGTDHAPASS